MCSWGQQFLHEDEGSNIPTGLNMCWHYCFLLQWPPDLLQSAHNHCGLMLLQQLWSNVNFHSLVWIPDLLSQHAFLSSSMIWYHYVGCWDHVKDYSCQTWRCSLVLPWLIVYFRLADSKPDMCRQLSFWYSAHAQWPTTTFAPNYEQKHFSFSIHYVIGI